MTEAYNKIKKSRKEDIKNPSRSNLEKELDGTIIVKE
jgi:hypothetical protein